MESILKICGLVSDDKQVDYYEDKDDGVWVIRDLPALGKKLGEKWTKQTREAEWHGFVFRRWRG